MKPAPFAYTKARSLEEAVALLGEQGDARLLAGGQSLIATLNMRLSAPEPADRHQRHRRASTASPMKDGKSSRSARWRAMPRPSAPT